MYALRGHDITPYHFHPQGRMPKRSLKKKTAWSSHEQPTQWAWHCYEQPPRNWPEQPEQALHHRWRDLPSSELTYSPHTHRERESLSCRKHSTMLSLSCRTVCRRQIHDEAYSHGVCIHIYVLQDAFKDACTHRVYRSEVNFEQLHNAHWQTIQI